MKCCKEVQYSLNILYKHFLQCNYQKSSRNFRNVKCQKEGMGQKRKVKGGGRRKGGGKRRIFRALSEAGVIEDYVWRL